MNAELEAIALENSLGARRYWFPAEPGDDRLHYAEYTFVVQVGRGLSYRDRLLLLCPVR